MWGDRMLVSLVGWVSPKVDLVEFATAEAPEITVRNPDVRFL
jgi:hypothetical protein